MQNKFKSIIALFIIILLSVGLFYFLNKNKKLSNIKIQNVTNNEISKSDEFVNKEGNKLILKLDNGTEKVILDIVGKGDVLPETSTHENKSENTRIYTFDKLYNDINYYGIFVKYYVGMDNSHYYLLVNKNNGNEISLPSEKIIISPNKQRIVSYNADLISGFTTNGLVIYNLKENKPYKEYGIYPEDWGPSSAKWINDEELEFEQTKLKNNEEEISGIIKFKIINDKWIEIK